jgi:hypothetical protein
MSIACHQLQKTQLLQEQMWGNERLRPEYTPDADAAIAILENQTVNFTPLQDPNKDRTVQAEWLSKCADTSTDDCDDVCNISGARMIRNCKEYTLTKCASDIFSVPIYNADRTDNDLLRWQNEVALGLLYAKKTIAERIGKNTVLEIEAAKGTNAFTGGIGTVSGTTTTVRASELNIKAMAYFTKVQKYNKFSSAFLLNGNNLWDSVTNANIDAANQNGQGDAARLRMMRMYWDIWQMAAANLDNVTYMIDPSALGIVTKARHTGYNPGNPRMFEGRDPAWYWSESLDALPGVTVDVMKTTTCNNGIYFDNFKVSTYYDILFAPERCDAANTGILKFECA